MAITDFQRTVCRLLASGRIRQGDSYVAGGVALNVLLAAPRLSRDIDLFHDTREALVITWDEDRQSLRTAGYEVEVLRERPTFVEALVRRGGESTVLQWVCDSAYRFFPLIEHADFGLTLHPFDLATNKLLALVGRVEARDWVDVMTCSERVQHFALLAWAACGKDPGYSPGLILTAARRTGRYGAAELAELAFEGDPPDAVTLATRWAGLLAETAELIELLPPEQVGRCVLARDGRLLTGCARDLTLALRQGEALFHEGRLRGAWPAILK